MLCAPPMFQPSTTAGLLSLFSLSLILAPLLWSASGAAAPTSAAPTAWGSVRSDLPPDPKLSEGTLPNGLRYVLLPNGEPENRISLRLVVAAGSLYEREDQRGFAHFVEHMAFRGTKSHPGQGLMKELQRRGVDFGMGHTAFTGWDWTLYQLELPDCHPDTLAFGLGVLREYAEEIDFVRKDVETERGVILAEKATRAHPDVLSQAAKLEFLFPDSLHNRRNPIGLSTVVRTCSARQLRDFYDTWYRPERMAVVVVGAIDPKETGGSIARIFGGLKARNPAPTVPADLVPSNASRPNIDIYRGAREDGVLVLLEHPKRDEAPFQDRTWRVAQLHAQLAFAMFQRRLQRLAEKHPTLLVQPRALLQMPFLGWQLASLSAGTSIRSWQETLPLLEKEHRRAFQHGFTRQELKAMQAAFEHGYLRSIETAATRPSPQLAAQLMGCLLYGGVFATPETIANDLRPALASATVEDCTAAFRRIWTSAAPHVFVIANENLAAGREAIATVLNASRDQAIEAPDEKPPPRLAYDVTEPPATPKEHRHVEDLDVHQCRYDNGVALNFKSTDFAANQVLVYVNVGSGRLLLPKDRLGLDQLAQHGFLQGGLRRHSLEELNEICQAHTIGLSFQCDTDSHLLCLQTNRADLPLGLRLIRAYLTDAAFRPEIVTQISANIFGFYRTLAASPAGVLPLASLRHLLNGEHRFRISYASEMSGRTIEELKEWLHWQLREGPLELSIVGDVPWSEALQAVGATLGNLPPRLPYPDLSGTAPVEFAEPTPVPIALKVPSESGQPAIACHWPMPHVNTIERERRSRLLSDVLEERLRQRLRDELGSSYNLNVEYHQHEGMPQLNYLSAFAEFRGTKIREVVAAIREEASKLARGELSDDLMIRVHRPFIQRREQDLRSNAYWGYTVLRDAQRHPERLTAARNRSADCAAITKQEVLALAAAYLPGDSARVYLAVPFARQFMTPQETALFTEITGR